MPLEHEYALLGGYNRSQVGRWLTLLASSVSAGIVFLLLAAVNFAQMLAWNVNLPPIVLSLAGAGAVYTAIYFVFDRYLWKVALLGRLLKAPDLSGQWQCQGTPRDQLAATPWDGRVTIVQSWDRIRIHVETAQSSSDSVAAALLFDAAVGYRLMYHYRNQPRIGQPQLGSGLIV